MSQSTDTFMRHSLELARAAVGSTSPNPPVGAVVVRDGRIVGEGHTQPTGGDHAEKVALGQAGELARGSSLYVTLEPCSHQGRTPPCTDAIITAGVEEVHASVVDPNPQVSGRSLDQLRRAGILVTLGEGREEAEELIAPHAKFITTGTPLVTAKFAMSLDGKIATRTGDSKWITSEESRRYVHTLRAQSDAIMVGIGTVLSDDPQLTARDADGAPLPRQPLRVIADSRGRLPPDAMLLKQPGRTLVFVSDGAAMQQPGAHSQSAEWIAAPGHDSRVDLRAMLTELGRRQITSLLVEGGGTVLGSLFDEGLVNRVIGFVAPVIIGGSTAPSPVSGSGVERISDAMRLNGVRIERFGDDVAIMGNVRRWDFDGSDH